MEIVHQKTVQEKASSDIGCSLGYTNFLLDANTHCDATSPAVAGRTAAALHSRDRAYHRRNHSPQPEQNRRLQIDPCSSSRGRSSISSTSSTLRDCTCCATTQSSSSQHTQDPAAPQRPHTACCSRRTRSRGSSASRELPSLTSPANTPVPNNGIGLQQHHSAFLRAWHYRVRSSISASQAITLVTADTMQLQQCTQRQSGQQQQGLPGRMQLRWSRTNSYSSHLQDELSRLQHISNIPVQDSMSTAAAGARLARHHAAAAGLHSRPSSSSNGTRNTTAQQLEPEPSEQRMFHRLQAVLDDSRHPARLAAVQSLNSFHDHYPSFGPDEAAVAQGTPQHVPAWDWQLSDEHSTSESLVFFDDRHGYDVQAGLALAASPVGADVTASQLSAARAAELLGKCTVQSSKKQVETCCICLDDIAVNQLAPLLMCGHRMHRLCLVKWLGQRMLLLQTEGAPSEQLQDVTCPTCKQVSVDRELLSAV